MPPRAGFARGLASRENIVRGLNDSTYHGIVGGEFRHLDVEQKRIWLPSSKRLQGLEERQDVKTAIGASRAEKAADKDR